MFSPWAPCLRGRFVPFSLLPPAHRTNRTPHLHPLAPTPHRHIPASPPLPRTIQQTPRLPIFLKPRPRRPRIEPQFHQPLRHLDRHHIPHILRHNMHHHEIHVFLRERLPLPSRPRLIFLPLTINPPLHLHSPENPPPNHHKIKPFA